MTTLGAAEDDVRLLGLLLDAGEHGTLPRIDLGTVEPGAGGQTGQTAQREVDERGVVDVSAGDDGKIAGRIVGVMITQHLVGIEARNGVRRAKYGTAERVMREHRIREHVVDIVIGRVLAAGDFLENDLALGENVLVREGRVDEHVGENLEAEGETLVKQARVEAGVLARGEGVEFSTQRIERGRDVERHCASSCP